MDKKTIPNFTCYFFLSHPRLLVKSVCQCQKNTFLITQPKLMLLLVLKRAISISRCSFQHPKIKNIVKSFTLKIFVYLNLCLDLFCLIYRCSRRPWLSSTCVWTRSSPSPAWLPVPSPSSWAGTIWLCTWPGSTCVWATVWPSDCAIPGK